MQQVVNIMKGILACVALACFAALCVKLIQVADHADLEISQTAGSIREIPGKLDGIPGLLGSLQGAVNSLNQTVLQVKGHEQAAFDAAKRELGPGGATGDNLRQTAANLAATSGQFQVTAESLNHRLYDHGAFMDVAYKTALHIDQVAGETEITTKRERAHFDLFFAPCIDDPDKRTEEEKSAGAPDSRPACMVRLVNNLNGTAANVNRGTGYVADAIWASEHPSKWAIVRNVVTKGATTYFSHNPLIP